MISIKRKNEILEANNLIMLNALEKIKKRQAELLGPNRDKSGDLVWRWANNALSEIGRYG